MARVHLLSAAPDDLERYPKAFLDLEHIRASACADRFRIHSTTDDPEDADIILFVEVSGAAGHYFELVRRHPVYRAYTSKCYLFSATDKIVPFLPGIYASVERSWYWPNWTRSGHYLGVKEAAPHSYAPTPEPPTYLFSFVGSTATHAIRSRIMQLEHPRGFLLDTHAEHAEIKRGARRPPTVDEFRDRYAQSIERSAFVLCPRGGGTSSFRLFEAMMLGRPPVVLSDEWVAPQGPDWKQFSLRIKEAEVDEIPAVLEAHAGNAWLMGKAARAAWLEWFSEAASFHRIVESCLDLQASAAARTGPRRYAPHLQMLRPYHAARWAAKRLGHGRSRTVERA